LDIGPFVYPEGRGHCFISSELKLKAGDKNQIKALMDDLCKRRMKNKPLKMPVQEVYLKDLRDYFAGKLIEELRASWI
jgi:UDP-N-acetylmuramate dehydrogenase